MQNLYSFLLYYGPFRYGRKNLEIRIYFNKKIDIDKKMQSLHKTNKATFSNDWLPALKIEENSRKRVFIPTNSHLYHYAGNNPIRYIDPDGNQGLPYECQLKVRNYLQNRITFDKMAYWMNSNPSYAKYVKEHTIIEVNRSKNDKYRNGIYFQSRLNVKYDGKIIFSCGVQSTADYQSEVDAGRGRTIDVGSYTGTLLNKSDSYNNAISITGNGVAESEFILCHPNAKTAKGATEEYANGEIPFSAGCQILRLEDFNELTDILKKLGFIYGEGKESWVKGDTIRFNINAPEVN